MGQTVCSYVYPSRNSDWYYSSNSSSNSGKKSTTTTTLASVYECEFELWGPFQELVKSSNNASPTILTLLGTSTLFILALWIVSFCIRFKDHTRSYVVSNLLPMTLLRIVSIVWQVLMLLGYSSNFFDYYYGGVTIENTTNAFSYVERIQFVVSSGVFLLMNLYVAIRRTEIKHGWILYYATSVFIAVIYLLRYYLHYNGSLIRSFVEIVDVLSKAAPILCSVVYGGLILISLFSLCCCTAPRLGQPSVPSVANARSRLGWGLLFVKVAYVPLALSNSIELYITHSYYNLDVTYVLIVVHALCAHLTPAVFCVSAVLFLPGYRSAFFCSQGYGNGKVADLEAKPQRTETKPSPPVTPPAQLTQTLSIPAVSQANSPYLNTPRPGPAQHDFGSVLTNPPNAVFYQNQPLPTPIPISLPGQHSQQFVFPGQQISTSPYDPLYTQPLPSSVPSVQTYGTTVPMQQFYMAPSTTVPVEQYQVVQHQPQVLTQHQLVAPAPMRHHVVSTPQLVTAPIQTNLVRFASQPNLAPMTTLHTTVSTPHLNLVPQSPFYIPS